MPKDKENKLENEDKEIKELIVSEDSENSNLDKKIDTNKDFEETLIDKIKNN